MKKEIRILRTGGAVDKGYAAVRLSDITDLRPEIA